MRGGLAARFGTSSSWSGWQDAALYVRRDACRYPGESAGLRPGWQSNFLWRGIGSWLSIGTCSNVCFLPGSAARQSRREFIRHVGSAVALGAVMSPFARSHAAESQRATAQKTLVGSNIYGWGQYAQRDKKKLDVEEVISALRDTGYDYLETNLNVAQPEENAKFAEQLKAKGLQPVSLYTGARVHEAAKAGRWWPEFRRGQGLPAGWLPGHQLQRRPHRAREDR